MASEQSSGNLVVVGASAGGIDARSIFVSALPEGFPAPVVIAQHLDPKRESYLADILQRRTQLAVRTVVEREPLRAGVVYIVPPNRFVEIAPDDARVWAADRAGSRPSIDVLLTSAAAYGENLIAISDRSQRRLQDEFMAMASHELRTPLTHHLPPAPPR